MNNKFTLHILCIAIIFSGCLCCKPLPLESNLPFDFSNPDNISRLPKELQEISGLSYHDGIIYAIQDEVGVLYSFIIHKLPEIAKRDFEDKGDFEGVEVIENEIYVVSSDAELFIFPLKSDSSQENDIKKIDLPFKKKENFEGLGYSARKNKLLLAAKEEPENGKKNIYAFSPGNYNEEFEEIYLVDIDFLKEKILERGEDWLSKLGGRLSISDYSFNPSGIAEDPLTGNLYILSYPLPQLLVINENLEYVDLIFLKESYFPQPEGICFDTPGNIIISNEGKYGAPSLIQFTRQKND